MTRITHAEDEGCLTYVLHRRADDPREVVLYEQWRTAEALDGRVRFCETISAPFLPSPYLDNLGEHIWIAFQVAYAQPDRASTRRLLEQMTLEEVAAQLSCPLRVLHGDRDTVVPPSEADTLARAACAKAELHRHPKGNHACVTVLSDWALPLVTSWATRSLGNSDG